MGKSKSLNSVQYTQFRAEVELLYTGEFKRPATLRKVKQVLRELQPFCVTTGEINAIAISKWLNAHPGRRARTRQSLLGTLRAAIGWGVEFDYCRDPFARRPVKSWIPSDELEEPPAVEYQRTKEEIAAVLNRADLEAPMSWEARRLRAAVYMWAFTGAGHREVLGLRCSDIDLVDGVVSFRSHPVRRLKTGRRAAQLPIAAKLAKVLEGWLPETGSEYLFPHKRLTGPWFHGRIGHRPLDRVKQLGERAGVKGLTILSFRHTLATHAPSWGWSALDVQDGLRHARVKTQETYRHRSLPRLAEAYGSIQYG